MQNDDAYELTVASSIAAKNIGSPGYSTRFETDSVCFFPPRDPRKLWGISNHGRFVVRLRIASYGRMSTAHSGHRFRSQTNHHSRRQRQQRSMRSTCVASFCHSCSLDDLIDHRFLKRNSSPWVPFRDRTSPRPPFAFWDPKK